jgi:Fe-S-cluster containining protein
MPFECDKCGACCYVTGCKHYNPDIKLCNIYNNRPVICRVDNMADLRKIPRTEAYTINHQACKILKEMTEA